MKEILESPDGRPASGIDREVIRAGVRRRIDDPDVRLAPNDAERKVIRDQAQKHVQTPSFKPFLPPETYKQDFKSPTRRRKQQMIDEAANWDGIITGTGVVNIHKDETGKLINRGRLPLPPSRRADRDGRLGQRQVRPGQQGRAELLDHRHQPHEGLAVRLQYGLRPVRGPAEGPGDGRADGRGGRQARHDPRPHEAGRRARQAAVGVGRVRR